MFERSLEMIDGLSNTPSVNNIESLAIIKNHTAHLTAFMQRENTRLPSGVEERGDLIFLA
jgi:hypothetical protein